MYDTIIKGGRVATASDVFTCDIAIRDGKIVALGTDLGEARDVIDAGGRWVLPGGIDSHVHISQPSGEGIVMADDFESATRSAAMGGNTTILPFCLQESGQSLRTAIENYHAKAEGQCYTDVSFHMIISDPSPQVLGQELPALVRDGYTSFKIFMMSTPTISYKNHRFPPQIIAHAVWLYFRFPLSLRLVEEMLLERGIVVSYETIRRWGRKFGAAYAKRLCRKTPSREDIWLLDEVVVTIGGRKHWLWRAVDQDGYVLDEIVQTRRDTKAAKRLLIRLLKKQALAPKRIVTDKLRSYGAAKRDVMPAIEHRSHKGLNNRAENSHLPLRKRERVMQGFRSVGSLQQFVPVFSAVRNHFVPSHQKHSALATHIHRIRAMAHWKAVTGATA